MMGRRPGQRVGPQRIHWRPTPLGQAIEQARYEKHMTLKELAAASRVSLRTIKAIVAGNDPNAGRYSLAGLNQALFGESHTRQIQELAKSIELERSQGEIQAAARARALKVQSTSRRAAPLHSAASKGASVDSAPLAIAKGATKKRRQVKGAVRSPKSRKRHA